MAVVQTTPPFRAAVIGAGLMGALMDMPGLNLPCTYAGGFRHHPDFQLCALNDPNPAAELSAWGCPIYGDLETMLAAENLDVVSVAVSKTTQPDILEKLLASQVRLVIAEKPLSPSASVSLQLTEAYRQAGKSLLVNFSRRYSPLYQAMASRFRGGEEKVLSATINYAKGLLHNGSHAIDLCLMLFGNLRRAVPLAAWDDAFADDPSLSVFLEFEQCRQLHLNALDQRVFTLFEVDIITDRGRYTINNDHRDLHLFTIEDHVGLPPGLRLVEKAVQSTDYDRSILNLLDNARDVLLGRAAPLCPAETAWKSQQLVEGLMKQAREAGLV